MLPKIMEPKAVGEAGGGGGKEKRPLASGLPSSNQTGGRIKEAGQKGFKRQFQRNMGGGREVAEIKGKW